MVDLMRKVIFVVVFLILAGLVAGLYYVQFVLKPAMVAHFMSAPRPPIGVTVGKARAEEWTPRFETIGTFKAVPGINVASQVGGIVKAIDFTSGEDVKKGDLLLRIDDSTDQADLKSNLAMLKNAKLAFNRQEMLSEQGIAAKAKFDLARAARDKAQGEVDRTTALIAQKNIVAPFSGRLGIKKVDVGQYVAPGMALVSLQKLDPIYLDFQAPERYYGDLAIGEKVLAKLDAFHGRVFTGKIIHIDARINAGTRSALVRAEFANPDKKIVPGMFANVTVEAGAPEKVVTAPRTAVAYSLYGDSVYVVRPDDPKKGFDGPLHVVRQFVRVGQTRQDKVALLEGVKPGDTIVTQGQIKLLPNAQVRIEPGQAMLAPATLPLQ
jgi:membrane fusion protein (multidrug efflux system)